MKKKIFTIIILTYFLFTLNVNRTTFKKLHQKENILKIGILVPLSGEQKKIGKLY